MPWNDDPVYDTLYIYAAIEYDTVTEKGRLSLVVQCYKGNPANHVTNRCKLQGGTKVWENYTTGGTVSAPVGQQDNGSFSYNIVGTWHSMVDSNSYTKPFTSKLTLWLGFDRVRSMREDDGRKLDHRTLEQLRIRAVRQVEQGAHPEDIAAGWG
jgi:hypothetical protein